MDKLLVSAPVGGWVVPLTEVPDPAFAGGMIGEGAAIDPLEASVCAPCDGTITSVAKGRHAVTIRADNGAEILIHVGIDTVEANGAGLTIRVEPGQSIVRGDALIDVALDQLLDHATSLVTPIVIVNAREFALSPLCETGLVQCGAPLFELAPLAGSGPEADPRSSAADASEGVTVALPHGVHARPAAEIVRLSRRFSSRVTLIRDGRRAQAQSMTALMALGAGHGDRIRVDAAGPDALDAVRAVAAVLTTQTAVSAASADRQPVTSAAGGYEERHTAVAEGEIRGIVASRGLALGFARNLRRARSSVAEEGGGIDRERENLRAAVRSAVERLRGVQRASGNDILAAQLVLLEDPALFDDADAAIRRGKSAGFAWREAVSRAKSAFAASRDPRIAERVADLRDIEEQVLSVLAGDAALPIELARDAVLLADDLLPSELGRLDLGRVAGICSACGGPTSHAALMAAARGIPAIVGAGRELLDIEDGTRLFVDAERGIVVVNPEEPVIARARQSIAARRDARAAQLREAARHAVTSDGVRIEVLANLASEAEAREAVDLGAEGCGLLRTELLYLDRRTAPDETEQAHAYQAIADALGDRPLVIRTLDIGGDKMLPYLPLPAEENPLLGLRGLRAGLRFPRILEEQLAAILRVEPASQCRILLPMVTEPGEIRAVRRMLASLPRRSGTARPLGAMIETPASVALADAIAREADFLSIGSNDLAQYTLAMDRTHPLLAGRFDHLHPAVLRQIGAVCTAASKAGRSVSVCGALASEPAAVPILVGLGVRTLSVVPAVVPELKTLIRRLTLRECEEAASRVLEMDDSAAVRQFAAAFQPASEYEAAS